MAIYRVYVEKKEKFAIESKSLNLEIKNLLNINNVDRVRVLNRYDIENIEEEVVKKALNFIFAEPLVDDYFFSLPKSKNIFAVEYLSGQYDKRADFCEQCLQLISCKRRPKVKTAKIYILEGDVKDEELEKIKKYIINPIECKEALLEKSKSLDEFLTLPKDVEILNNFNEFTKEDLNHFILKNNLSISLEDAIVCQNYFKNEEKRPPTITEIKILDAYWSDHCRHTTFSTELKNITINDEDVLKVFEEYKEIKENLNLNDKPITLMEIATIGAKKLKKDGILNNLDESEEINACSVKIPIEIENETKDVLLMFKNETHNHPTEIEPFGGAATCLGGAIRDPLSGRCYVYQAMRITGAFNPLTPFEKTLKGKLPQRKIVKTAAQGYSSYGNQIGIATGFVEELYHKGYLAKRMEVGVVIGAVLKENVTRKTPTTSDVVILLGGKTGRDGCGGASGSSKSHTTTSLKTCEAEVQKGNPIEERKIQRLFLNLKITKLIKKCNDFGAGGVCVAIGELADGVTVDLDKIPKKYQGLDGTELAISESQERMAVVVEKNKAEFFIKEAEKENLTATIVAKITDKNRLVMFWRNKKIVNISRSFLNLNGAKRKADILVKKQKLKPIFNEDNTKNGWIKHLEKLNICSEKGLVKMFDSTIGANTVLMPYGGKFKATKAQSMAAIIPVKGNKKIASIMSYGANPFLQEQSPFYGSMYAVVESLAKIVSSGGSTKNCWLTFQEYFPSVRNNPERFGLPFTALLGALKAQLKFKVAAIGGKDSMSGSFESLDVPPTLISFAVSVAEVENIISPEFKKQDSPVALVIPKQEKNSVPNLDSILEIFSLVEHLISSKKVISAYSIGFGGVSESICKMCFGNKIGFKFTKKLDNNLLFNAIYGGFVLELVEEIENLDIIGKTKENYEIEEDSFKISLEELENSNNKTLEEIYPTKTKQAQFNIEKKIQYKKNFKNNFKKPNLLIKTPTPKVLIPVFPGTNCEFDLKNQFEKEGATCDLFIINNLNEEKIKHSIKTFANKIESSNIIAIPGGFSASDEPDGSAKFIAAFFKNSEIRESTNNFLKKKDGLMLGICNGFQALIKLGLIETGSIADSQKISATLTYNSIGIHQSDIIATKILSTKSPWLMYEKVGDIHKIAISHGEGKLIATEEMLETLIENEQIATVYVNEEEKATMLMPYNPNGSFLAIEGLTSKDGKIFGKMGHSERMRPGLYKNIPDISFQKIFKAGVDYFK